MKEESKYTIKTQNRKEVVELQAKNGLLNMDGLAVEPDKCVFHADDSGRIIHIGANKVR